MLLQFADAALNIKAFEISTTVQPNATGRRGVGFKFDTAGSLIGSVHFASIVDETVSAHRSKSIHSSPLFCRLGAIGQKLISVNAEGRRFAGHDSTVQCLPGHICGKILTKNGIGNTIQGMHYKIGGIAAKDCRSTGGNCGRAFEDRAIAFRLSHCPVLILSCQRHIEGNACQLCIFDAGWFTDETYTTPYTKTTGNAYAKFVDASMMTVKKQFNANATNLA